MTIERTRPARHPRRVHAVGLALAVLFAILPSLRTLAGSAARADDHDLWYVIDMAGKRSGWMHSARKTDAGLITTTDTMRLDIKRGRLTIKIVMDSTFVETEGGKPVSMKCTSSIGTGPKTVEYTFHDADISVLTSAGDGEAAKSTAPLPEGVWLPPAAAGEFTRKRLEAGATTFELRTMDPMQGPTPYTSVTTVLERTTIEALGKSVPAIKVRESLSNMAGIETVSFIDERGTPIRSSISLGDIPMTIVAADKDLALSELDPPEIMQRTFVKPDKAPPHPRRLREATYILSVPEGALPAVPATGWQRVEPVDGQSARVIIRFGDQSEPARGAAPAPAADATDAAYTQPSGMLESADESIKDLVAQATARAGPAKPERAEAMRRFVFDYISKKNLGVGFASAKETARTREGDCSEHGCLLAAMLRADGIPSRVVSGLIFVDSFAGADDIFAYHMWAEGLLEIGGQKRWIDLDATLPEKTPFDATHIALTVSSLADNQVQNPMVAMVPLLGRLSIKVEKAE